MSRPNPPRPIARELAFNRRLAYERGKAGWSYEQLAEWMNKAGCPIAASAIYKSELADQPRRVTIEELVAYSRVFGIPVEQLLLPREAALSAQVQSLVAAVESAWVEEAAASERLDDAWDELLAVLLEDQTAVAHLRPTFQEWQDRYAPETEEVVDVANHEGMRAHRRNQRRFEHLATMRAFLALGTDGGTESNG